MAFHAPARNLRAFVVSIIVVSTFLFGVNGDCSSPPTFKNVRVQITADLTVGSTVAYACVDGYQMSGPADSVVLVCSPEENWVGPEIDCTERISCSPPFSPAYGSYNVSEEGFEYQSVTTFSCQDEYTLEGSQSVVCTSFGQWLENGTVYSEPRCIRVCSEEEYRYQYHECYERMGSTGSWDYAKGNCEVTGGQLATIKDPARQSFVEGMLNGQSSFYWIGGYENDRDWKYPSDGQYANYFNWAPQEPSTPGETCVYLSNVNGAENSLKWNDEYCDRSIINTTPVYCICETGGNCSSVSTAYSKRQYGDKCLLFIDDTPRDQPSSKTKCTNEFGGILVEIENQIMQDFIENVINDNGFETANWWIGLEEGFERTWSWVDGERISQFFWGVNEPSTPSENCLDILPVLDYKWNDDVCSYTDRDHICQYGEARCGNPGAPYRGNVTSAKESYEIGEAIYFSCDDGYTLSDPVMGSLTCQNDSNWSGTVPNCLKIICSDPAPEIPNTVNISLSHEYRGVTLYECLGNYILNGYPVSVCQEDGTWSIPNATCTEIPMTTLQTSPPDISATNATPTELTELTWTETETLETSTAPSPTDDDDLLTGATGTETQDASTISTDFLSGQTSNKTTAVKYTSSNLGTVTPVTSSSSISLGPTLLTTNNSGIQSSISQTSQVAASRTTAELTTIEISSTTQEKYMTTSLSSKTPSASSTTETLSPEVTTYGATTSTTEEQGTVGTTSSVTPIKESSSPSIVSSTISPLTESSASSSSIAATTSGEPFSPEMTSNPRQSEQQSEGYSKEPVSTKEPSSIGLIIGLSVTAGIIAIVMIFILLIFVGVFKLPGSKSTERPLNDGVTEFQGIPINGTLDQKSETAKTIGETYSGDNLPQEVVFQMTDIKPLIHTADC